MLPACICSIPCLMVFFFQTAKTKAQHKIDKTLRTVGGFGLNSLLCWFSLPFLLSFGVPHLKTKTYVVCAFALVIYVYAITNAQRQEHILFVFAYFLQKNTHLVLLLVCCDSRLHRPKQKQKTHVLCRLMKETKNSMKTTPTKDPPQSLYLLFLVLVWEFPKYGATLETQFAVLNMLFSSRNPTNSIYIYIMTSRHGLSLNKHCCLLPNSLSAMDSFVWVIFVSLYSEC